MKSTRKKKLNYYGKYPDINGKFGKFGGIFVPEILMPALEELKETFKEYSNDPNFQKTLNLYLHDYAGRPTPLYFATRLSEICGCKIYLKREDLVHGGAHKLNNTLGQGLLAVKMNKKRIIAETGAGQHGLATATAGAVFGVKTEIFMGEEDMQRQKHNVQRMELLGAKVHPVYSGSKTLKDAINEAMRDWITNVENTHYMIGSVVGPHPYPLIVREFQRVIGKETKLQIIEKEGRLPNAILACVGGGSNAIGTFYDFIEDPDVELYAIEAGGKGLEEGKNAASLSVGREGVLHGAYTYVLQDRFGQIETSHSVSAGLDYPGVGPEHALLKDLNRIRLATCLDKEAVEAFTFLSQTEGIIPALEPCHAIAYAVKIAENFDKNDILVITLSGRGDKDIEIVQNFMERSKNE